MEIGHAAFYPYSNNIGVNNIPVNPKLLEDVQIIKKLKKENEKLRKIIKELNPEYNLDV